MYLTVMRLQQPNAGHWGVNIYVHWHPDGLPNRADPWLTMANPGPDDPTLRQRALPRPGNRVQAYIDIVLEDDLYTPEVVDHALERMADVIADGASNPEQADCGPESEKFVGVRFAMNNRWADRGGMLADYEHLRHWLTRYVRESLPTLPSADARRATLKRERRRSAG